MTLTIHRDLTQGTDEWLEARRGLITASVVGQLITSKTVKAAVNDNSRALWLQLLAERVTGRIEPVYVTQDMLRGQLEEPLARDAYSTWAGVNVEQVGFMTEDKWGYTIGYSPDGLVGDQGLIEIKSRRARKHVQTILAQTPPHENMAQLQAGLLVSGREWIDYVSYCSGMPLYVTRVYPNHRWADAILTASDRAYEWIDKSASDYQTITNSMPVMPESTFDQELTF